FFSSRRRHTRCLSDWSSDVCSSDLVALGADAVRVRMMVLRQVAIMTLIGAAIGMAFAIGIGKGAASLLYEIKGYDPMVFIVSTRSEERRVGKECRDRWVR